MTTKTISFLGALIIGTAGCTHTSHQDAFNKNGAVTLLPQLTAVATGPAGGLLANGRDYHGDFTLSLGDGVKPMQLTGQIFVRNGKACWETIIGNYKSRATGGFSLVWDPTGWQGFVSSEALQGYAPLYVAAHFTPGTTTASSPAGEPTLAGHPVDQASETFQGSDGPTIVLQMSRALDFGNLPLQIHSVSGTPTFTLTLSNIQPDTPVNDLFVSPDGFTKYPSEQAMLDELAERQHNVYVPDEIENMGQPGTGTHKVNNEPGSHP